MTQVRILQDSDAIANAAAQIIIDIGLRSIAKHGRFSLVLSGGSTPQSLYRVLATADLATQIQWSAVHVFWGDERCVPSDHADSNYRMAKEMLLDHVNVLPENIYRIKGEIDANQAAIEYEEILRNYFGSNPPNFDALLLGMGTDGHTASLFPNSRALDESQRWVVGNYVASKQTWRVTLTSVAINAASNVIFLVTGDDKAESVWQVIKGSYQPRVLPSQLVKPSPGNLLWMLDEAAAARL